MFKALLLIGMMIVRRVSSLLGRRRYPEGLTSVRRSNPACSFPDYGLVFLLKPFGFHLAMNTLSSKTIVSASEALPPLLDMTPLI